MAEQYRDGIDPEPRIWALLADYEVARARYGDRVHMARYEQLNTSIEAEWQAAAQPLELFKAMASA